MGFKATIQAELENFLKREGMTINQFSGISGVNSGTLSSIINGNRPIAMQQLDRITSGMGLAEGSFYELYVDQCFIHSAPNWRRLGAFLHRCAELNKLECIQRVVKIMMDNLSYAQVLFETAEEFFNQGKWQAAALLYEGVAESEKYQHSERLALCQYRLFTIALGDDQDINLQAATHFEYFIDRLDEADQLNALQDLANIYASLQRWSKVDLLAQELGRKAAIQYKNKYKSPRRSNLQKESERPLCFYILYSQLLRSAVCDEYGDYAQALHYVSLYSDMSWVREDTEEAYHTMEQFKEWSTANALLYRLMSGQMEVLSEYVDFIGSRNEEIFPALYKILQAANRYQFNVDEIINRFSMHIAYKEQHSRLRTFNIQITADRYTSLLCELATYYLNTQRYKTGIMYILKSLESSVNINNESTVIRCVGLFEQFRHHTSREDQNNYKTIISEVKKHNEKKIGCVVGSV